MLGDVMGDGGPTNFELSAKVDAFHAHAFIAQWHSDIKIREQAGRLFVKGCSDPQLVFFSYVQILTGRNFPMEILEEAGKALVATLSGLKEGQTEFTNRLSYLHELAFKDSLPIEVRRCAIVAYNSFTDSPGHQIPVAILWPPPSEPTDQTIRRIEAGRLPEYKLIELARDSEGLDEQVRLGAAAKKQLTNMAQQKAIEHGFANPIAGSGQMSKGTVREPGAGQGPRTPQRITTRSS